MDKCLSYFALSITHSYPFSPMLRHTIFLLSLAGPVSAQNAISTAPVAVDTHSAAAPVQHTAADTVQAIHRIYVKHRRVGSILTVGALVTDFALAGISAANENKGASSGGSGFGIPGNSGPLLNFGFGGFAVIYGIVAAPVMGIGIQQLIAFGPRHEARVIARYQATHQLPTKISCRLRKNLQ